MTFPGMWIVYYFGRRQVLLYGAVVMFAGQIITGAIGTAMPGQEVSGKVLIAFSCIFVAGFATTWGPVVWVVCAETFPTRMSAKCVTLATASNVRLLPELEFLLLRLDASLTFSSFFLFLFSLLQWAMNTVIAFVVPIIVNSDGANLGPKICFGESELLFLFNRSNLLLTSSSSFLFFPFSLGWIHRCLFRLRPLLRSRDQEPLHRSDRRALPRQVSTLFPPPRRVATPFLVTDLLSSLLVLSIPAWRSAGFINEHFDLEEKIESRPKEEKTKHLSEVIPDSAVATPSPSVHNV